MGLIKAVAGAVDGVLADSWKDYFYCEALPVDTLMCKGEKRINSSRSSNTSGNDNIINDGAMIAVNDGQFMIIVQQGEIVEFCGEPGEFVWNTSTEPSLFTGITSGNLGQSLIDTFNIIGRRITTGGDTAKDQRVYFFNTKEILGNKYGTANPVPFRIVDTNVGLDTDIPIKCNGEYSYKIMNPLLFYKNVCGNEAVEYTRDRIDSQLKSELLTALQPAFAKISLMGIRYSQLPGQTTELAQALNEELTTKWRDLRGIEIVAFGVNTVKASEEDENRIKDLQFSASLRDPSMAAARLAQAQADAMVGAANNENAGSVMAFAGLNMANQAGGSATTQLFEMANQQAAAAGQAAPAAGATPAAPVQGAPATDANPAAVAAAAIAAPAAWACVCGTSNTGKFCTECGKPRPQAKKPKCNKCGWEPAAGEALPKFCPECGDLFDGNDVQ